MPGWTPAVVPITIFSVSLGLLMYGAVLLYRRSLQPAGLPAAPMADINSIRLQGLGGWLVLVGMALITQPILSITILSKLAPMMQAETWHSLTSPTGANYYPIWAVYLLFDLLVNTATVIACVLLLIFFFQRRRLFPIGYIVFLGSTAVFKIFEAILNSLGPEKNTSTTSQTLGVVLSSVIWILYMRRSQRVKLTFIR